MNQIELDAFLYEIRNWNNIPLGSKNCGVNCIFCKINADPILKRFPKIPSISLDELYIGYQEVDRNYPFVRLGAGVIVAPHTDPFVHNEIYTFIRHTADYFPELTVTTVTTASYLELSRIDELCLISNYGIDLSLVTMQSSRETLIPYSTRDKLDIILDEAPIRKISLMFTGDILELYRDLDMLDSRGLFTKCEEILVRRIEHTRTSPSILKKISKSSIASYEEMVSNLLVDHPDAIYTVPYINDRYFKGGYHYFISAHNKLEEIRKNIHANESEKYYVMAPDSTYLYLSSNLVDLQNTTVLRVPNLVYGGSITVAGLLTNQDLYAVLDPISPRDSVIIVSRDMFDKDYRDICGVPASDIERRYLSRLIIL